MPGCLPRRRNRAVDAIQTMERGTFSPTAGGSGQNRKEHSARFHKKTKPQNSNCKAASAALSGFAFQKGVLGWHSHESPSGAFDRPNRSALCADAARRFWAARLEALCLASAAMQRFCDASQFLQNLCFLMSLALCLSPFHGVLTEKVPGLLVKTGQNIIHLVERPKGIRYNQ